MTHGWLRSICLLLAFSILNSGQFTTGLADEVEPPPPSHFGLAFTYAHRSPVSKPFLSWVEYSFTSGALDGGTLMRGIRATPDAYRNTYLANEWYGTYRIDAFSETVAAIEPSSWPVGAAYDARRGVFYIATLEGEGFLYKWDTATSNLTQIASLQNKDLDSLTYHFDNDSLYGVDHTGKLLRYSVQGELISEVEVFGNASVYVHGYRSEVVSVGASLAILIEPNYAASNELPKVSRIYKWTPGTATLELTFAKTWTSWPFNTAPGVELRTPTNGTSVISGQRVVFEAAASDYESGIDWVRFYANGAVLGQALQPPNVHGVYRLETSFPNAGEFSITVVARDLEGKTNTAGPITLQVGRDEPHGFQLELPFTYAHKGPGAPLIFFRNYTLTGGPLGGGRLFPGMLLDAEHSDELLYGTEDQGIYRVVPKQNLIELIPPPDSEFSWPTGVAVDDENGGLRVVSLGGAGDLYAFYEDPPRWNHLKSMENIDVDSLGFNSFTELLYALETKHSGTEGKVLAFDATGKLVRTIVIPDFPFNIGPGSARSELVSMGTDMILMVEPRFWGGGELQESRIYRITREGNVTLTYRKVFESPPPELKAPTVHFVRPENGSSVRPGTTLVLEAGAADIDGTIQRVDFYNHGNFIARGIQQSGTQANTWLAEWPATAKGVLDLRARAVDNHGLVTYSKHSEVRVEDPNIFPSVMVLTPTNLSRFPLGEPIRFVAQASDRDGRVVGVRFLAGGKVLGVAEYLPTGSTNLFGFTWTNAPVGNSVITAEATDDRGGRGTANVTVIVPQPHPAPQVAIVQPGAGARFVVGQKIEIVASVQLWRLGISKVEIFANGQSIGIASRSTRVGIPEAAYYELNWFPTTPGEYKLRARASDSRGTTGNSPEITILVAPTRNVVPGVSITSPQNGARFNEDATVVLKATATDRDGTVSKIEFYRGDSLIGEAILTGTNQSVTGQLSVKVVTPATWTVTARATDNQGGVGISRAIIFTVAESGDPSLNFSLNFLGSGRGQFLDQSFITRSYTEEGAVGGSRLLPGIRLVDLHGSQYGTVDHSVYQVRGSNVVTIVPAGAGIPEMSWPRGVAADTKRNRLVLVTLGGEGHLYAFAPDTGLWSLISSMKNVDVDSIVYNPVDDLLYALKVTSAGMPGRILKINAEGQVTGEIVLPAISKGIGLNGLSSELVIVENHLVVLLESDLPGEVLPPGAVSMMIAVDLRNGISTVLLNKTWEDPVPSITMLSPAPNTEFSIGELVRLSAVVLDLGPMRGVDFLANGVRISPASRGASNVWSGTWIPNLAGEYQIVTRVVEGAGRTNLSSPVRIVVHPRNQLPIVRILEPTNHASFAGGRAIPVVIHASDTNGVVMKVEVFANDQKIGDAQPVNVLDQGPGGVSLPTTWRFTWENAPQGTHRLTAKARDNQAGSAISAPINITVTQPEPRFVARRSFVRETNGPVLVKLAVSAGGAFAYAVQDRPPRGWTVSRISHEGVFDSVNGLVKFGPFTDGADRALSYVATPAKGVVRGEFNGEASADGKNFVITGDRVIELFSPNHPADINADFKIELAELTGYAASWKSEKPWEVGGAPIPVTFVTRAGQIWRQGERYTFAPALGAPPACWVPAISNITRQAVFATAVGTRAISPRTGGATVTITLQVPEGTGAYAIEERLPEGWAATEISGGGEITGRTIRWGPFLSGESQVLSYTASTAGDLIGAFSGTFSTDGGAATIAGDQQIGGLQLGVSRHGSSLVLTLSEPAATRLIIEASATLPAAEWRPAGVIEAGGTTLSIETGHGSSQFYRLRSGE